MDLEILPHREPFIERNQTYVERLVKFMLWQKGGSRLLVSGCKPMAEYLARVYSSGGERAFDAGIFGEKIFYEPLRVVSVQPEELPPVQDPTNRLGGHLDGCRIGFDLGGSDRKCAAVIDGKVVFSEEIAWNPYFEKDPEYHRQGIRDSLNRAAAHLPRVDAIGGSAAGVYVNNDVKVASLFRGVPENEFYRHVRGMFHQFKKEWGGIPFEVVNDGEVTALAGSMYLGGGPLLGISMGTSLAAGYCDADGNITSWLNELAFVPVDYRDNGPVDEWSGDAGCGVQYFSQQGVGRLATTAGFTFDASIPLAERLVAVQEAMKKEDPRARKVFETIGTSFGYALAHYAESYDLRYVLILGRVTSGTGGEIIIDKATELLNTAFPALAERVAIKTPDEKMKRHGQAVVAASLPALHAKTADAS
jgi:predicted NBD/HSP70 family sugar kinase